MWLKFGVAKLLCIYIGLTKFEENPEGSSFFCVDLTWNDPIGNSALYMPQAHKYKIQHKMLPPARHPQQHTWDSQWEPCWDQEPMLQEVSAAIEIAS